LEKKQEPLVKRAPDDWIARFGGEKMLIPTPLLVDETVRKIPAGWLTTVSLIREYLARTFKADFTCPLTTGIFLRIVAETAEEDREAGREYIAPYWRVVKDDGTLNPKFPGGVESQAAHLENEGFTVERRGKTRWWVQHFENRLFSFEGEPKGLK
jgi:hypothetical protein